MKKILVVGHRTYDDEALDLKVSWGQELYRLMYVSSGEEAIRISSELEPDVFLINYILPDMDGIDLFDRLHARPELGDVPGILSCLKGADDSLRQAVAARKLYVLWQQVDLLSLFRLIEMALSAHSSKRQVVLQGAWAS